MKGNDSADRRLEDAPRGAFDANGDPRFGTYAGSLDTTALGAGVGALTRLRREKRWQWFLVGDETVVVGGAVVDLGPLAQVFAWVLDRQSGELVVDETRHRPGFLVSLAEETTGRVAWTRGFREQFAIDRSPTETALDGELCGVSIDLGMDTAGSTPVTAICPVDGGVVNVTRKAITNAVSGTIDWGRDSHTFSDGIGLSDATHGVLAPATSWRWAIGCGHDDDGQPVGFNVVTGFNDGRENVVWLDGEPHRVGAGSVTVDSNAGDASTADLNAVDSNMVSVRTDDGVLDATMTVEGAREETTTLPGIGSEYRQPVGTWQGTIADRSFSGVLGVAEDHSVRW